MAKTNDQSIQKYEAPERVQSTVPANGVTLESLCNGGDIVLRGVGKSFQTEKGTATPVFFQHLDDYEQYGPTPMEKLYSEDGKLFLSGRPDGIEPDEDGWAPHVYQFLTASVIVLRAAKQATEVDTGITCRVTTRRSASTGNMYYALE